ncbi:EamA family transporter [Longispora albida]|uniref:EamA family transporter n=1 Tax=Longispora albida TaxID=203523 RepID=UPI000685C7DC|nr:EamA family transporter [Longispora albida]
MKPRDLVLAVLVAAIWGVNFIALHVVLEVLPPLLFNAVRFGLVAFPAVLFIGWPQVAWRWVLGYGLTLGVVKFSLLYWALNAGMPPGLASVLLQAQAGFTIVIAFLALRERPSRAQLTGLGVAVAGMAVVAVRVGTSLPPLAFALMVGAAIAWGTANVITRKSAAPDALRFLIWASGVATVPLFVLSFVFEGPPVELADLRWIDAGALVYTSGLSMVVGFAIWGTLIRKYTAGTVAPFSMLVPFFGLASTALFLGERPYPTDLLGGALVVAGVLWGARKAASSPGLAVSPAGGSSSQQPRTGAAAQPAAP